MEFNREVAEDAALYWSKKKGDLARLIDEADKMGINEINAMGDKAKQRIRNSYGWKYICNKYIEIFIC